MSLKIVKKKNVYQLKGKINTKSVLLFLNFFTKKIDTKNVITINIDKVTEIDKSGMNAIQQLFIQASNNQKNFSIIGAGCKEIYNDFSTRQSA